MTAVYRLTKIEANKPEVEVFLSETEYESLMQAVQVYDNWLTDSEPFDGEDELEIAYWQKESDAFNSLDAKILQFNGVI